MRILIAYALLAASVCAAQDVATSPAFTLVDERTAASRKNDNLSLLVTTCDYAIYQVGDKRAPGRLETLRADLERQAAGKLAGKTLHIPRYDIYLNNGPWARRMAGMATWQNYDVPIEEEIRQQAQRCPREKTKRGWFDPAELDGPYVPIVIELTAELEGAKYDVRVVQTTSAEMGAYGFKSAEDKAVLAAAMRKAAEALAAQLP